MTDKEIVFNIRKRVFEDWRSRRLTWQEVKDKYGFSKAWFYKFRARFVRYGDEGLRDRNPRPVDRSHEMDWSEKVLIMGYICDHPTHGPDRIRREMHIPHCTKTIWNYLVSESLNTRRKRRLWAESQGKPTLTDKEKRYMASKHAHIQSSAAGELISMDSFTASIKSLGRVWQFTACDTYSSYGWAKVYAEKTSDNAVDFFINHILKNTPEFKIKRVLTDRGAEFHNWQASLILPHFTYRLNKLGIIHSLTKVQHPWTNGYAERLNQTIWQEFYLCRLSKPLASLDELNDELQCFMRDYNFKRMHSGYKLKAGGFKYPGHAFYDIRERDKVVEVPC
jgi:transposase InsO family protein